jgi:hypothetical protein
MIEVEIAEETTFDWGLSRVNVSLNHNNYNIGELFLLGQVIYFSGRIGMNW